MFSLALVFSLAFSWKKILILFNWCFIGGQLEISIVLLEQQPCLKI